MYTQVKGSGGEILERYAISLKLKMPCVGDYLPLSLD
jgi:hypothetical protein